MVGIKVMGVMTIHKTNPANKKLLMILLTLTMFALF
jgi:hypothetical protein